MLTVFACLSVCFVFRYRYYYYNNNTGACEWEKPADFDGAKQEWEQQHEGQSFASMGMNPQLKAVLRIQSRFRARRAKREVLQARRCPIHPTFPFP